MVSTTNPSSASSRERAALCLRVAAGDGRQAKENQWRELWASLERKGVGWRKHGLKQHSAGAALAERARVRFV